MTQMHILAVCRSWGFERPVVHVAWFAELFAFQVLVVFAMKWEWRWLMAEPLPFSYYEKIAESWAVDARVPIAEEL